MEISWRDELLVDSNGKLTNVAIRLLEDELADERLAIAVLTGQNSTQYTRNESMALILNQDIGQPNHSIEGVRLLASLRFPSLGYSALILDLNVAPESFTGNINGIMCTVSSLLLVWRGAHSMWESCSMLIPFASMVQSISSEYSKVDIHELLPSLFWVGSYLKNPNQDIKRPQELDLMVEMEQYTRVQEVLLQANHVGLLETNELLNTESFQIISDHLHVKKIFGLDVTGKTLLSLLNAMLLDVAEGSKPDFGIAWDHFISIKYEAVAKDALSTYIDCIHQYSRELPPMELDAFDRLHYEFQNLALDIYHSTGKIASNERRKIRQNLKFQIKQKYEEEVRVLRNHSLQFCRDIRHRLWNDLNAKAQQEGSFDSMLKSIQDFIVAYNAEAKGPEKLKALLEFFQEDALTSFQQLEAVVSAKFTDKHIQDIRAQAELEFIKKKEALVDHFQREERQLKNVLTQEIEMMKKVYEAKILRSKIDESEVNRLKGEIVHLERQNAEADAQRAVLDHAKDDLMQQKKSLEAKVAELNQTLQDEISARLQVVDALANALKTAETKESDLHSKIHQLQEAINKSSWQAKVEAKELSLALKKRTEEKEELQKRLNDFFLRATSLPESLQQHLFCFDNQGGGEQIEFADALTNYMTHDIN